jgi:hypothetical protein
MLRTLSLAAVVLALGACADDLDRTGHLDLSLTGRAPSGDTYRLRDATLTIAPSGQVLRTEDDPDRTSIAVHLDAGLYTLDLGDGWRLERTSGGAPGTVFAVLTTPDPLAFDVVAGARTAVNIGFRANGEAVPLGQGDAVVAIDVDDRPPGVDAGVPTPDAATPSPDAQVPADASVPQLPNLAIVSGPIGATNNNSPIFEFVAFNARTVECRLTSDAAFLPCISPFVTTALLDRDYQFEVRATGAGGTVVTAARAFSVDTVAPVVTITSNPIPGFPMPGTPDTTPTFGFATSERAVVTCQVDSLPAAPCASPFTTPPLTAGGLFIPHAVAFRATDDAGNASATVTISFYVLASS